MTTWTNQDRSGAEEKSTYLVTSGTDVVLLDTGTDKLLLNASVEQELTTSWTNQPKS